MRTRIRIAAALGIAFALGGGPAGAQTPAQQFPPQQVQKGASIYSQNCAPCHGSHMADPQGAFDLRTFPPEQKSRFLNSVTKGKNAMPPWGGLFNGEEIESLWAYVMAGEKR
ncbi:MAG TPA: cytochrome c [Burkholderiales bacterium]|nr:cytochrome c [Burkholderiales bacterium]